MASLFTESSILVIWPDSSLLLVIFAGDGKETSGDLVISKVSGSKSDTVESNTEPVMETDPVVEGE